MWVGTPVSRARQDHSHSCHATPAGQAIKKGEKKVMQQLAGALA